jgi:ribonuclease Z
MGIPGLIASRRFGKGAVDKPLTVYYPDQSRGVQGVRELLGISYAGVVFPVTWAPLSSGAIVPLGKTRTLHAFAVRHTAGEPALGYKVVETRRRLKPEFAALTQAQVEERARKGQRDALVEEVPHITFAHSGDAMPLDPALVAGADLLVHDATFLSEPDRREPIHATTEEALEVGRAADVKTLVLNHLSIRYDRATAIPLLREQVTSSRFAGDCWLLDEGEFVEITKNK